MQLGFSILYMLDEENADHCIGMHSLIKLSGRNKQILLGNDLILTEYLTCQNILRWRFKSGFSY